MDNIDERELTALILTFNEEENIGRVLERLKWLPKVIVLDSHSTDGTIEIVSRYPNAELAFRNFDTHANQWNYGLSLVHSRWVLTLDADYVVTREFVDETVRLIGQADAVAYLARFRFVVFGKPLRRNNTTPRPVLFQKEHCSYYDDGHTQRLDVRGRTGSFKSYILHDDRKPLSRWLRNLDGYSIKECRKMLDPRMEHHRSLVLKVRRTKVFAPFLVFFYCLFVNGALLDGWRGWYYTIQRTLVEMLFALRLIEEEKFRCEAGHSRDPSAVVPGPGNRHEDRPVAAGNVHA